MKIGFVNFTEMDYDINTPHVAPLGGSESAMCYLAGELARVGHSVTLFNQRGQGEVIGGVVHWSREMLNKKEFLAEIEVMVLQNTPDAVDSLKQYLPPTTKLIFWTQHAHDQKAIAGPLLKTNVCNLIDGFVFISHWQMENYLARFPILREKCTILRNAIAPSFLNLFKNPDDIIANKSEPILAYTSVPFRGLELLFTIFPLIRERVPKAKLKIYSSMSVYQMGSNQELKDFGEMYQKFREMEGVEYIGSVSQRELATAMKEVVILAYSNTFAETSCISVMEAMAAGAQIISSELGAMPETVMPFGKLIPVDQSVDYVAKFVDLTISYLERAKNDSEEVKVQLGNQVLLMNKSYSWELRASEWTRWLETVTIKDKYR